jgi:uncharacterized protein (TIGR00725 family)
MQIGIIGSAADLNYSNNAVKAAQRLGKEIARRKYNLVFGAEQDCTSLSTIAAISCRENGGITVGITYGTTKDIFDESAATIVVPTGLIRGGGREMVQSLACDGIIAIAGGSGTLNEIAVAYQANIPVVMLKGYGGWSDRLAGTYLDERNRYRFASSRNTAQAVAILEEMILSRKGKKS